ncbi:hypothetical protein FIBSPDRAFT_886550 [Athelia psychrophila]|uniref:Uncharacterized protein n=1 Tax=Athelia psychrophila TaxID=1759441 RepID=A0A166QLL5_9AGAM|nr:hypothetical protein FIBSPDRAFT_886550 [Fibularhizoctonia sp. CBS 109695]
MNLFVAARPSQSRLLIYGFIQHVWRYWFPPTIDNLSPHRQAHSGIAVVAEDRYIEPCYDENGTFIAYISRPKHREPKIFTAHTPSAIHIPTRRGGPLSAPIAALDFRPRLDVRPPGSPNRDKRTDQKRRDKPLPATPIESLPSRPSTNTALPVIPRKSNDWDGWPDGDCGKFYDARRLVTAQWSSHGSELLQNVDKAVLISTEQRAMFPYGPKREMFPYSPKMTNTNQDPESTATLTGPS